MALEAELRTALYDVERSLTELQALPADEVTADVQKVLAELLESKQVLGESLAALDTSGNPPATAADVDTVPSPPNEPSSQTAMVGPHLPSNTSLGMRNNNARMHPRNHYAHQQPDFEALAQQYPSLQQYLKEPRGRVKEGRSKTRKRGEAEGGPDDESDMARDPKRRVFDFGDDAAARELTKVLLHHDYGIDWWIPVGQLIPPVTNRANYIHWIEDLLRLSSPPDQPEVRALDIGCGCNLIYPLIGAALHPDWHWVAVDVTDIAVQWAQRNVDANQALLQGGSITVRRSGHMDHDQVIGQADVQTDTKRLGPSDSILPGAICEGEQFSFTVCNPPFFSSMREAGANPKTDYAGTESEMVYPGGELAFVGTMAVESSRLPRGTVHWYSSMVGRKESLKKLRSQLYMLGVTALRTTDFCQGRTTRWGIAWSWTVPSSLANQPLPRYALH